MITSSVELREKSVLLSKSLPAETRLTVYRRLQVVVTTTEGNTDSSPLAQQPSDRHSSENEKIDEKIDFKCKNPENSSIT